MFYMARYQDLTHRKKDFKKVEDFISTSAYGTV